MTDNVLKYGELAFQYSLSPWLSQPLLLKPAVHNRHVPFWDIPTVMTNVPDRKL